MAYRPSPHEFPELLRQVPPVEHNQGRNGGVLMILLPGLAVVLVAGAYARESVLEGAANQIWKPGIGIVIGLLMMLLGIATMAKPPCLVRRGSWVAIYKKGKRADVVSIGQFTVIQLRALRTIRLVFAALVTTAIGGIGTPLYLMKADDPRLVAVMWLLASLLVGIATGIECVVGRTGTVVKIGPTTMTLPRPL